MVELKNLKRTRKNKWLRDKRKKIERTMQELGFMSICMRCNLQESRNVDERRAEERWI